MTGIPSGSPAAWSRRQWLMSQGLAVLLPAGRTDGLVTTLSGSGGRGSARPGSAFSPAARVSRAERQSPGTWPALMQRAVDAARTAGAQYADARVTRLVRHVYGYKPSLDPIFVDDTELLGVGVRALVGGTWGFSASTGDTLPEVTGLAQDAVADARAGARGSTRTVEMGTVPVATGTWTTPHRIDPFDIPIEEKLDTLQYWKMCARDAGLRLHQNGGPSWLACVRQERVVATSDGACFTQTLYETGGELFVEIPGSNNALNPNDTTGAIVKAHGLDLAGAGWERIVNAGVPDQLRSGQLKQELQQQQAIPSKPFQIGKYVLVCDGATMAALVDRTLGVATQLDRALGYEANASGTSWLDAPLTMVGQARVAPPFVTLTANRSVPEQLATVQWDDEGVVPQPFPLVKDGVLVDFQTTREQAAWLAPYYQGHGQPVQSHGCAVAESGHFLPLQQMPNLTLAANPAAVELTDLVKDVKSGILVERGRVTDMDAQARTGVLRGAYREIVNGRLGRGLSGGAVVFRSVDVWKGITALGGAGTQATVGYSPARASMNLDYDGIKAYQQHMKGEPPQQSSYTVQAVAATLPTQPMISTVRKA